MLLINTVLSAFFSNATSSLPGLRFVDELTVMPLRMIDTLRNFRLALAHELQHLRNGDPDWLLLLEACKLLCCWNPAMYYWYHELDALQEYACDEAFQALFNEATLVTITRFDVYPSTSTH
jgi:hypothetical protein